MRTAFLILALIVFAGCGGSSNDPEGGSDAGAAATAGLSEAQLERGIGPIETVALGDVDEALAEQGEEIFKTKCSACHKMDARYVGPALGDVLEKRSPEYVMNMMLNPEEMIQKHPEAKAMLAEFMTPMPNQQLTEQDARAVLEYLRTEQTAAPN